MTDDDRRDLLARLFAMMTAKLEDGAAMAADGQAHDVLDSERRAIAERIYALSNEVSLLAEAAIGLSSAVSLTS